MHDDTPVTSRSEMLPVRPSVAQAAAVVGRCDGDVEACYVWGSRLYGCARPDSDWDVVVVLRACVTSATTVDVAEDGDLNVSVYPFSLWADTLRAGFVWALALSQMEVKHTCCLRHSDAFNVPLVLPMVRKATLTDAKHNWQKAMRLWDTDRPKACKNVVHSLRYLRYGLQIVRGGRVTDYTDGNDVWAAAHAANVAIDSWDEWCAPFLAQFKILAVAMSEHHVQPLVPDQQLHARQQALAYVRQYGADAFQRDFCASVRAIQGGALLVLAVHKRNAPCGFSIARDTKLLVVTSDLAGVVAQSDGHVLDHSSKYVADFPWTRPGWTVAPMIKARGDYLLFFWRDEWHVSSAQADEAAFWDAFRGWAMPPTHLATLAFSFVLAATTGLLYCYGAQSGAAPVNINDVELQSFAGWRFVRNIDGAAVSRQHVVEMANQLQPLGDEAIGYVVRSSHYAYAVRVCSDAQAALASIRERVHDAERGLNEQAMLCVLRCSGANAEARLRLDAHFRGGPHEGAWRGVVRSYDAWVAAVATAYDELAALAPSAAAFATSCKHHRYGKILHVMRFALKDCAESVAGTERVHLFARRATPAQIRFNRLIQLE